MGTGVHGQKQVAHPQMATYVTEGRSDTHENVIHPLQNMVESTAMGDRPIHIHARHANVVSYG